MDAAAKRPKPARRDGPIPGPTVRPTPPPPTLRPQRFAPGPDMLPPAKPARTARAARTPSDTRPVAEDRTLAMLAHALGIVTGILAPLVLWMARKDSATIEPHAREALNFQITLAFGFAAALILSFVVVGWFLLPLLLVADLVFGALAAQAAYQGQPYRYPVSLRLVPGPTLAPASGDRQA